MLTARATSSTVTFIRDGELSEKFKIHPFEVLRIQKITTAKVHYAELSVILPGYPGNRGAWLLDDAVEAITKPGRYTFAADLKDLTMEFRAICSSGVWYRVHNANPEVVVLREWPVDRW